MHHDIEAIQEKIHAESAFVSRLLDEMGRVIVGQRYMIERLLVGLLADGHVLMEGVPELAKTMTVRTLASAVDTTFRRIQFTPDLLPADLIGTLVYDPQHSEFKTRKGPIFANIILADEINRSPAKVQSALLEAMQERTVTIGHATYGLEAPFLVLATQNPIEQEGTYPLPEAQIDRDRRPLTQPPSPLLLPYCSRSATIGSTRVARRAGIMLAAKPATTSTAAAEANDGTSNGLTPYSTTAIERASRAAEPSPTTTPTTISSMLFRTTSPRVLPTSAPSAIRSPISRVR
jgi:hypothetical protein